MKYQKPKITAKKIKINFFFSSPRFLDSYDELSNSGRELAIAGHGLSCGSCSTSCSCCGPVTGCLALRTVIATPDGDKHFEQLKIGDQIWSLNEKGLKISSRIIKLSKLSVTIDHVVYHLVLNDARELFVSPEHPTADYEPVNDLEVGEVYDGSEIVKKDLVKYTDNATFDLLPESDTGVYWANGILLGSTLKYQQISAILNLKNLTNPVLSLGKYS